MAEKELTGRIARDRIVSLTVPRMPQGIIDGFLALGDGTSVVSDTLDELGLPCALTAPLFRPTVPGKVIAGPALTVRNIVRSNDPFEAARESRNGMAEYEAHNLAEAGDVIVIDGVPGVSNMAAFPPRRGSGRVRPGPSSPVACAT